MSTLLKNLSKLPLRFIQNLAQLAGSLLYISHSSARRVTAIRLACAYAEPSAAERADLSQRSLQRQCMTYAGSVKTWGSSPEDALSLIQDVHGEDICLQALHNPQGSLAVVPHFGTWELL